MSPLRSKGHAVTRAGCGTAAGITEEMIHGVVHTFYARVRGDPAIGPVFAREIGTGWDVHLAEMCNFWSSVLLATGRFKGNPVQTHVRIGGLRAPHFARWLHLFEQTSGDICPPHAAAVFIARSQMIAQSLQLAIAHHGGERFALSAPSADAPPNTSLENLE